MFNIKELDVFLDNVTDKWGELYDGANPPDLGEFNLEYLGIGGGRVVYKKGYYVYKFVISENGDLQSEMESKISSDMIHPMLCPTMYSSYGVNVMPYVEMIEGFSDKDDINDVFKQEDNYEELMESWNKLFSVLINEYNLYSEDVIKVTSWGKLNDKFVLFDYGCTNETFYNHY